MDADRRGLRCTEGANADRPMAKTWRRPTPQDGHPCPVGSDRITKPPATGYAVSKGIQLLHRFSRSKPAAVSRPLGKRRRVLVALAPAGALLASMLVGCMAEPSPQSSLPPIHVVIASLPPEFRGVAADVRIIDDDFTVGVDADDVLEALGVTRRQAVVVVAEYGPLNATAMGVSGVDPRTVLATAARTWGLEAIVSRTEATVADRPGYLLVARSGRVYLMAEARGLVYVVGGPAEQDAAELIRKIVSASGLEPTLTTFWPGQHRTARFHAL